MKKRVLSFVASILCVMLTLPLMMPVIAHASAAINIGDANMKPASQNHKTEGHVQFSAVSGGSIAALTSEDSHSVGIKLTVPEKVCLTDFSTMFDKCTDGTEITLRVYRWNETQHATTAGVVLYESVATVRCAFGTTSTAVVDLPSLDSGKVITDGDYFFVWTASVGQAYIRDNAATDPFTNVTSYADGVALKSTLCAAASYVTLTDEAEAPVDPALYTKVDPNKAHVILIAGQSNAAGSTANNDLFLHDWPNASAHKTGYPNVQIYYNVDQYPGATTANSSGGVFETVKAGQGAATNKSYFGIEVGLAEYLQKAYPGEKFYIIKSAIGGSSLAERTDRIDWTDDGYAWNNFKTDVPAALEILKAQGLDPEIMAMLWMQGESDAESWAHTNDYLNKMNDLMERIDALLSADYAENGMAFIDAAISTKASWEFPAKVNAQKRMFASASQNRYYLSVNDLPVGPDTAHYTAVSMLALSRAFGEAISQVLANADYTPKEPEVPDKVTNVALGKNAAGALWNDVGNMWTPPALTDGLYGAQTQAGIASAGTIFNAADSGAFTVTLDGLYTISSIKLHPFTWEGFAGTSAMPSGFTVDAFTGTEWIRLITASNQYCALGDAPLTFTFEEIDALQILFTVTAPSARGDFSALGEIEVFGCDAQPALENLAVNKPIAVSPMSNVLNFAPWTPGNMIDGKTDFAGNGIYFNSDGSFLTSPTTPTEIIIDLKDLCEIHSFEVYPFQYSAGVPQGYGMPTAYTVSVSTDGVGYTETYAVSRVGDGFAELGIHHFVLDAPIEARYVKVHVTEYPAGVTSFGGIGEFKAMGKVLKAYEEGVGELPDDTSNVALGKSVSVSNPANVLVAGDWQPSGIVDGVIGKSAGLYFTRNGDYLNTPTEPMEVYVDLGGLHELYAFEMHPFQYGTASPFDVGYGMPTAYTIDVSTDGGVTYQTNVYAVTGASELGMHRSVFASPVQATHIRIRVTEYCVGDWGGLGTSWCGIGELAIIGKPAVQTENVLLGKDVVASTASDGAVVDGWGAQFMTDGIKLPEANASSGALYFADPAGVSFTVDLDGTFDLYSFALVKGMNDATPALPQGFILEAYNGTGWHTVKTVVDADTSAIRLFYALDGIPVKNVTRVRLTLTAGSGSVFTCIGELEVNGILIKSSGVGVPSASLADSVATVNDWKSETSSSIENPTTILVDLGALYEVNALVLYPSTTTSATSTLPRNFEIQVSCDGSEWETVYTYENLAAVYADGEAFTAAFPKTYASYVRMIITADGEMGYSEIGQLQVRGTTHTTHFFTEKVMDEAHMKLPATCMAPAIYSISCICGENGSDTFAGTTLGTHAFTLENTDDEYLATPADCTTRATYYFSCACGEKASEAFAFGEALDHLWSATYLFDMDGHWRICTRENCGESETPNTHSGGTATANDKAICAICHQSYGELLPVETETIPETGSETEAPSVTESETASGDIFDDGNDGGCFGLIAPVGSLAIILMLGVVAWFCRVKRQTI